MSVKKSTILIIGVLILIMSLTLVYADGIYPNACNGVANMCGDTVQDGVSGSGGVSLCGLCYGCGVSDGVCPSSYSDGEPSDIRHYMMMRLGGDRPGNFDTEYKVIYSTGNQACESIGGTCSVVQAKQYSEEPWTNGLQGETISCSQDITTNGNYFRAVCIDVPRVAGCTECPDPDCTINLRGLAYDATTEEPVEEGIVRMNSSRNIELNVGGRVADGTYDVTAVQGNLEYMCTAAGYIPQRINVTLQPGDNLVDCRLSKSQCNPSCLMPNIEGDYVCEASCHNQNGCFFNAEPSQCDGRPAGTIIVTNRLNVTHVEGYACCGGIRQAFLSPIASLEGNDEIKTLIVKDVRKELNDQPVTLKIITYQKE